MPPIATLVDLLHRHAAERGDAIAYRFDPGGTEDGSVLSFAALRARALAVAASSRAHGAEPGDRVLLVFPPGLDFVAAFFGCLAAGLLAVPMMPPRRAGRHDASAAIIADCAPRLALTSSRLLRDQRSDLAARLQSAGLRWLAVDEQPPVDVEGATAPSAPAGDDLAFLQYTSGSTSSPKGVMVGHANLLADLEMIRAAYGSSAASTCVSWVPLHHDMGLILNALASFHAGASCVLMPPVAFLQRPMSWLRAIHRHGAEIAGGPNFAFDHCVERFRPEAMTGVDLSRWKVAINGAEPVRAATLRRFAETFAPYGFRAESLYPCYGMAEATVLATGRKRGAGARLRRVAAADLKAGVARTVADGTPESQEIVGCGAALPGTEFAIVDADTRQRLGENRVGEIWLRGPHVGRGYWNNPGATAETFGAELSGRPGVAWLRTGDLGLLDGEGELYVTGRAKDVIIIRGVNHYPQDIEVTVQAASRDLRPGYGAAFGAPHKDGSERVVVVQEIAAGRRQAIDAAELTAAIREAIVEAHEVAVADVVLVMPGSVPRTTSGKIQRGLARQMWQDGRFAPLVASPTPKDEETA